MASGASGILLHEAIGHGLEADFNRKGISIYADKLNERIACDEVSIVDDGTIHGARGALSVDDEGEPTERTVLVENGFLKRVHPRFYQREVVWRQTIRERTPAVISSPTTTTNAVYLYDTGRPRA